MELPEEDLGVRAKEEEEEEAWAASRGLRARMVVRQRRASVRREHRLLEVESAPDLAL